MNEKFLKVLFAVVISYYFGLMILQYNFKVAAFLGLATFVIIYLTRIEYAFYFLLASRTIVDIFYSIEAAGDVRMTHIIGGLLSVLFVYYVVVVSRYNIFSILSLNVNKIYGVFLAVSIPSIFFTERLITGLGYWFRLFQGFLILNITILIILNAGNESYKKGINIICWAVIIALFVPSFLFFQNYIQGIQVRGSGGIYRYSAFAAHVNIFSYLLLIILPFCLFLYSVCKKNSIKILWLIFIAMIIYTLYITYTRNMWIGLVVLLFTWNVLRKNFIITFSVIGIAALMIIFSPLVQDRLKDIYIVLTSKSFFELDPKLGSARIGVWQANLRYFIDHSTLIEKLLGNGFDVPSKVGILRNMHPIGEHNNYITLLMTTGICGLVIYLLYILKLFQESFKLLKRTKEVYLRNLAQIFISLLLAYVIISTNTHIFWNLSFQYYFSVFAGFIIAANILEKEKEYERK